MRDLRWFNKKHGSDSNCLLNKRLETWRWGGSRASKSAPPRARCWWRLWMRVGYESIASASRFARRPPTLGKVDKKYRARRKRFLPMFFLLCASPFSFRYWNSAYRDVFVPKCQSSPNCRHHDCAGWIISARFINNWTTWQTTLRLLPLPNYIKVYHIRYELRISRLPHCKYKAALSEYYTKTQNTVVEVGICIILEL